MQSKKKFLKQNQSFEDFVNEQVDYNLDYVEWDKIIEEGQNKYLAFIDIIGFQQCLKISDKSAVKMLLTFNRCLKKIFFKANKTSDKYTSPYQIYSFSDCAYIVFEDNPLLVISKLVQLLHLLLGVQSKLLKDKWSAHVTPVIPRISLTYGKIISTKAQANNFTNNLMDNIPILIGTPIPIAYTNEKNTPPFGLFIDKYAISAIKSKISFNENPIKYSVQDFLYKFDQAEDQYKAYRRSSLGIEFPWLLMNVKGDFVKEKYNDKNIEGTLKVLPNDEQIDLDELKFKCIILHQTIKIFHQQVANKFLSHSIDLVAAKNYLHLERMISDHYSYYIKQEQPTNNFV